MEETHVQNIDIPDVIVNFSTGDMYKKGQFLGKGFFAKCYAISNLQNNLVYAAKVMPRSHANYSKSILNEVSIHGKLNHNNVIKLQGFFEDCHFGYILMEVCTRGCMQGMLKHRIFLTEPEVRYYMKQILFGVAYIHKQMIIHRDLKLGNILLTNDLEVKIGDFGTAVQSSHGSIHNGICGTPNYIAPEVVTDTGHSFEFDIFSTGCILYTLLLGMPPFQDATRERVFKRVEFCKYYIPTEKPSQEAKDLIQSMLQLNPKDRPTAVRSLSSQFMKGFTPATLPLSSFTELPQFEQIQHEEKFGYNLRKPLQEVNRRVSLTVVESEKKMNRRSPFKPKVGLKMHDNTQNTPMDSTEKSKTKVSKKVGPCNVTVNPFDTLEKSCPCPITQGIDVFSGQTNRKDVDGKVRQPQELVPVASDSCNWLDTENLGHRIKLMNRLCGTPSSNEGKITHHSNMIPCDKKLVQQNCIVASTDKENRNTRVACNGNTQESPRGSCCEPTENGRDTNQSNELYRAYTLVSHHKRQTVKTRMVDEAKGKSRLQQATASIDDVNTKSGMEDVGMYKQEAESCRTNFTPSFECNYKPESSNMGEIGTAQINTSSSSSQNEDTSYEETLESNGSSILCSNGTAERSSHQTEDLLFRIQTHLQLIINSDPGKKIQQFQADRCDKVTQTVVRVLRWHDYTSQYGFGYQLSNGSVGVMFNDSTNMVLLSDEINFCFASNEGEVTWYKIDNCSNCFDKKVRILLEFKKSFHKRQNASGHRISLRDGIGCTPYMVKQFKDTTTTVMLLTNETFQVDILNENTKLIFCPGLTNIIFVNANKKILTLSVKSILESGCCQEFARSLKYAFNVVSKIILLDHWFCSGMKIVPTMKRKVGEEMDSPKKLKTES